MTTTITPQHTVTRAGLLYYNRRVPSHAKEIFGDFIRMRIDSPQAAEAMTKRLDAIWQAKNVVQPISIDSLKDATKTKTASLSAVVSEYLEVKVIQHNPTKSSVDALISMSGDMDVGQPMDPLKVSPGKSFTEVSVLSATSFSSLRVRALVDTCSQSPANGLNKAQVIHTKHVSDHFKQPNGYTSGSDGDS